MIIIGVLAAGVLVAPLVLGAPKNDPDGNQRNPIARRRRVLVVVFGAMAEIALAILQWGDGHQWLLFMALLPATFVIQHSINIAVFKNPQFLNGGREPSFNEVQAELVPIVRRR
ncbi:MAG TPA: hypothetical protein VGM88_32110 [Kofleriaceae bacterium]